MDDTHLAKANQISCLFYTKILFHRQTLANWLWRKFFKLRKISIDLFEM